MSGIRPPLSIVEQNLEIVFSPADDLRSWVYENIISDGGSIHNPDHSHLSDSIIGFLWTNVENSKKGRRVVGQAEEPAFMCGKWQKARQELQMIEWFGVIPDFVITLDATYCHECTDGDLLSLIEHELYHCAQAVDKFGEPKFNQDTGLPMFTMRGHDVEEFSGVVRRYGIGNNEQLRELVNASLSQPEVSNERISHLCGTCI